MTTPSSSLLEARVERLDDAIRDILDFASGWCSDKLTDAERLERIRIIGEAAITRGPNSGGSSNG